MKQKALEYTFETLLNSLLRELVNSTCVDIDAHKKTLKLTNKSNETLTLNLTFYSILGKHQYALKHILDKKKIDLTESLAWIINFSCEVLEQSNLKEIEDFKERVQQSRLNIENFLNDLGDSIEQSYLKEIDFIEAESLLFRGHSFHPYPKARDGFNAEDFKKYSPEYKNEFSLAWAVVDKNIITQKNEIGFDPKWMSSIAKDCLNESLLKLEEDKTLLPVHPWQLAHIRTNKHIKSLEEEGKIHFIQNESKTKWFSTSSVRSIYSKNCKYMLKFSMSLRLTNSIRHLQKVEVERGIQVCDVTNTKRGKELTHKWPNFEILHEPAFSALNNANDEVAIESIVSCRINPFINGNEQSAVLLATLNQLSPNGVSILDKYTSRENINYYKNWFNQFTKNVIWPLLDAQANFGIFFGAHQQNIILKLDNNGEPKKLYFRDCQGTGYSQEGFKQYAPECKGLSLENGNILTAEQGNKIFCYYLIVNTAFDTITHLSQISGESENTFLKILNELLSDLKSQGVKDSSCIDYLLYEEYIWAKGNYKCCLKNINENTMPSPTDIYVPMKNPIKGSI